MIQIKWSRNEWQVCKSHKLRLGQTYILGIFIDWDLHSKCLGVTWKRGEGVDLLLMYSLSFLDNKNFSKHWYKPEKHIILFSFYTAVVCTFWRSSLQLTMTIRHTIFVIYPFWLDVHGFCWSSLMKNKFSW